MIGSVEDRPIVSVVVPTFNRAELLPRLAGALGEQRGIDAYELVFVDDASTDDTREVLDRLAATSPVTFHVLRTESSNGGPARPRNVGWRAARAPLVAFIDDDCVPRPDWLAELVAAADGADVIQGITDADPEQAPGSGPFARFIVVDKFSWKFETSNIAYRRTLLERLDGFDEQFPAPFGEDIDLGWRALAMGARMTWIQDAVVLHRVEKSGSRLRDWINWIRYAKRCELAALTVRKHPGLRRHMFGRYFYKPYHFLAVLAGLALAAAPRSRSAAVLLALPWVYYRTVVLPRPAPRKWLWAVLPMGFVVDAAEVVATVRGAAKYRTLIV
jgi:glycosyltransferase involved in cell wall biosynthesis